MENKNKKSPTFEEISVIEKATGGKITKHEWWVVKGVSGNFNSNIKPHHEEDIIFYGVLDNSFLSHNNEYVGDFERAEWYYKNRLKIYEPYPCGVAELYNEKGELEGYCGYTHRGSNIFRIGDRLFNEYYEPKEEDYPTKQWNGWLKEYKDGITKAEADGDIWWADDIRRDGVNRYIPFKLRGSKLIETFEEAAQAAINLSKYLS